MKTGDEDIEVQGNEELIEDAEVLEDKTKSGTNYQQETEIKGKNNKSTQAGRDIISHNHYYSEPKPNAFTKSQKKSTEKNNDKEDLKNILELNPITRPLQTRYNNYKNNEIDEIQEGFLKSRVLIVNSLDKDILYTVQNIIINEFGGYEGTYDFFSLPFIGDTSNLEIKDLKDKNIGNDNHKNTLIFIEPHDSFFSKVSRHIIASVKEVLFNQNVFIVCLISKSKNTIKDNFSFLKDEYEYLHIPFPNEMINSRFGIEGNEIITKIKNSQSYSSKEEIVYQNLKERLQENDKDFIEYIEKLDENINNEYEKHLIQLKDTFDNGDEITRTVLFVSTFFTHLDFKEFNSVVCTLLNDKKVHNESINIDNTDILSLLEATPLLNKWVNQLLVKDISLIDKWNQRSSKILKECFLQYVSVIDNVYSIEFESVDLKEDLRKYIENKYFPFVYQSYNQIRRLDLLFQLDLSNRLVKSILFLTVYYSKYEKEHYDERWLTGIVHNFAVYLDEKYRKENRETQSTLQEHDFMEILGALYEELQRLEKEKELKRIVTVFNERLADLIEEMFIQDINYFRRIVDQFLIHLINLKKTQYVAIGIVLAISRNLQHKFEFDTGKYLKHLFNQAKGNRDLLIETYNALFRAFTLEDLKMYLKDWLPKTIEEVDEENHKLFAIIFQLDYTILGIVNLEDKYIGEYPTTFYLLKDLDKEDNNLIKTIKWLLDDRMKQALTKEITQYIVKERLTKYFKDFIDVFGNNDISNFHLKVINWISALIEFWFIILHGLDPEIVHSKEQKAYQAKYIQIIKEQFSQSQLRSIKELLNNKRKIYGNIISNINDEIAETKNKKNQLKIDRTNIKNMRTILNKLRNQL